MSRDSEAAVIGGIDVEISRKHIKNIHLSVLPPEGRVRLSVPTQTSEQAIRLAIVNKLDWIRKQQFHFEGQPRQAEREMVGGECHYLWGQKYRLAIEETMGKHAVNIKSNRRLQLTVAGNTTFDNKVKLLNRYYREQMQKELNRLLPEWQKRLAVEASVLGIRKMKTKWGSCNIQAKRIWLNLELAKKPLQCLEFILVHELIHLHERHHNERFRAMMDKYLPDWQQRRNLLNSLPLAYEDWSY